MCRVSTENTRTHNKPQHAITYYCAHTAVQEERGPRKSKSLSMNTARLAVRQRQRGPAVEALQSKPSTTQLVAHQSPNGGNLHHQILVKILVACVQTALGNEHFRRLDASLQYRQLRHVWSECFVLRAAHWSINVGAIVDQCECPELRVAIRRTHAMRADFMELALLETVVLCRAGECAVWC